MTHTGLYVHSWLLVFYSLSLPSTSFPCPSDPTKFLPFGIAIIVILATAFFVGRTMLDAAELLKVQSYECASHHLNAHLVHTHAAVYSLQMHIPPTRCVRPVCAPSLWTYQSSHPSGLISCMSQPFLLLSISVV